MYLGIPQIIYLSLTILGLGIHLAKHGEKKDEKYNFFTQLLASAIILWILMSGGFFK